MNPEEPTQEQLCKRSRYRKAKRAARLRYLTECNELHEKIDVLARRLNKLRATTDCMLAWKDIAASLAASTEESLAQKQSLYFHVQQQTRLAQHLYAWVSSMEPAKSIGNSVFAWRDVQLSTDIELRAIGYQWIAQQMLNSTQLHIDDSCFPTHQEDWVGAQYTLEGGRVLSQQFLQGTLTEVATAAWAFNQALPTIISGKRGSVKNIYHNKVPGVEICYNREEYPCVINNGFYTCFIHDDHVILHFRTIKDDAAYPLNGKGFKIDIQEWNVIRPISPTQCMVRSSTICQPYSTYGSFEAFAREHHPELLPMVTPGEDIDEQLERLVADKSCRIMQDMHTRVAKMLRNVQAAPDLYPISWFVFVLETVKMHVATEIASDCGSILSDEDSVINTSRDEPKSNIEKEEVPQLRRNSSFLSKISNNTIASKNTTIDDAQLRRRKQKNRHKRNAKQLQTIMGWYPTEKIEQTIADEEANAARLRESIQTRKAAEIQALIYRISDTEQSSIDDDDGNLTSQEAISLEPQIDDELDPNISMLKELALAAAKLERQVTAMECIQRGETVYSSASTIDFSIQSAGLYNFTPNSVLNVPASPSFGVNTPLGAQTRDDPKLRRVFSKSLVRMYEKVAEIPVPSDDDLDAAERDSFLDKYRISVRGHTCALLIQSIFRMHRCRAKYLAWRKSYLRRQKVILDAWMCVHRVDKFARMKNCRRVFVEWADEVGCSVKLRLIELKLLQQSATKVAMLSNIVKNLFLTTVDDKSKLYKRPTPNYSYQFVNQAYSNVLEKKPNSHRILEIREQMSKARDIVSKQFVQTVFLKWKAYHEAHSRTAINATLCLRRAMRMAFLQRPQWLGERVQVVFEMWWRYTTFQRHKRLSMDVPLFPVPLAQWDLWLSTYKARQLRKLAANARGPLMWMHRYFRFLRNYVKHSQMKKSESKRARTYCTRRQLALIFSKWRMLTLQNLETRGAVKKAFYGWQTYTAMKFDCRLPKRKMQQRTKSNRIAKAWEGWKQANARRNVLHIDRISKILQPNMYQRLLQCVYQWAKLASQEYKRHLFMRWKSRLLQRKLFAKFWCASSRLYERTIVTRTFEAWKCFLQGISAAHLELVADEVDESTLVEHTMPFVFEGDIQGDGLLGVELDKLHAFHRVVRDGHENEIEALVTEDPRLVFAREPVLGNTALHIAVLRQDKRKGWFHHRQVLLMLIHHGASPFAKNLRGESTVCVTIDANLRQFLRTEGYGFHKANSAARMNLETIDTWIIWRALVRMMTELKAQKRCLGDPDLGTWHSFMQVSTNAHVASKWIIPRQVLRRRPFLYIMANKLLERHKIVSTESQVEAIIQAHAVEMRVRLIKDRLRIADTCTISCFRSPSMEAQILASDRVHEMIPSFQADFYFGKDVAHSLEHDLRIEMIQPLLDLQPPVDSIEAEVERLDSICNAAEAQLVQVERNNAKVLAVLSPHTKCFGSTQEAREAIEVNILDKMLQVYFKLQQLRMVDKLNEKDPLFMAMESRLPSEIALLHRIELAIDERSQIVTKAASVVASAESKTKLYQDAYDSLMKAYQSNPTAAQHDVYSKLVASRILVEEAKIALSTARRKLSKQESQLSRISTLKSIFYDLLHEQRTWTKEEFATLDGFLAFDKETLETLQSSFDALNAQRESLLEESSFDDDARMAQRNFKTTAKRLLLQLHVLHQMQKASSILLSHQGVERTAPAILVIEASMEDMLADNIDVSPIVVQVFEKHLARRKSSVSANIALAESQLMQSYKRSLMLLFADERRIISNEIERQLKEEARQKEVFQESNPLFDLQESIDNMDQARRETKVLTTATRRRAKTPSLPFNRKRLELQKAPKSQPYIDWESTHEAVLGEDIFVGEARNIVGMQFGFGNFAARAYMDSGAGKQTPVEPTPVENAEDIWKSNGEAGSLSVTTLRSSSKVSAKISMHRKSETHTVVAPAIVANVQPSSPEKKPAVNSVKAVVDVAPVSFPLVLETSIPVVEAVANVVIEVEPPPDEVLVVDEPKHHVQDDNPSVVATPEYEEIPQTPLMQRLGISPNTPILPRPVAPTLTAEEFLTNLDNYERLSEAVLQHHRKPPAAYTVPPTTSESPPLLLTSSASHGRMRSFHELMLRDEGIISTSQKQRRYRPKKIPKVLPALSTSFSLDGTAFKALHTMEPKVVSKVPVVSNNYIVEPTTMHGELKDSHSSKKQLPLANIELHYDPQSDPVRVKDTGDHPKYHVKTKRESRPFLATTKNTSPPRQPAISNVVLVGNPLLQSPAVAPISSISSTVLNAAENLSTNEKNAVWSKFASQPLSPIIEAAYSELYPNTYLTSTALKSKAVQELKDEPVVKSNSILKRQTTRQDLGLKSDEICFWQAVEGFKSIRDEAICGITLPPAKARRKRRSIEIAHEFLAVNGPLSWMAIEYPDLIEIVERGIQKDDVPLTLFDGLQAIVHERLIQKRSSSTETH